MSKVILTTFVVGNQKKDIKCEFDNVEIIYCDKYDNDYFIHESHGDYVSFIDSEDSIDDNYFDVILKKINANNFDVFYINNDVNFDYKKNTNSKKICYGELSRYIPRYNNYAWMYVFKKNKLIQLNEHLKNNINGRDYSEIFSKLKIIDEILYHHNQYGKKLKRIFGMMNRKDNVYAKNIIYVGSYCSGRFNGYISWLLNLGEAFYKKKKMILLYDSMKIETLRRFQKYFNCICYNDSVNYLCDSLSVTYSTFYYPLNIYVLDNSNLFIHGNMDDFENARRYRDDFYDNYYAVSKICAEKAKGYFKTDNIQYIYNPYVKNRYEHKKHLKLVSALRNSPVKGVNRIEYMASVLDELSIPYTWNVFIDRKGKNKGGLIFRNSVLNIEDYIIDHDYLVNLSQTESFSYNLIESLCNGTKVVMMDIDITKELGLNDGENGFIIPISYFDEGNKDKLKEKLLQIYNNKDLKFEYDFPYEMYKGYEDVFK